MIDAAFLLGAPLQFRDKFLVYPPTVMDVAASQSFWQYFKVLTLSQEEIEDELLEKLQKDAKFPTPFEFMLNNAYHSEEYENLVKKAFLQFTHQTINFIFDQKCLIIGDLDEQLKNATSARDFNLFTEDDFFDFQNLIRISVGSKTIEPPSPDEDPRVKRIKAKARYRDKIKSKSGMGLQLPSCIASICCMGIGLTPLNIGEMSYAAIDVLLKTYQEKEKYEIDVRSLQAGADFKKIKPKYWIRNIE